MTPTVNSHLNATWGPRTTLRSSVELIDGHICPIPVNRTQKAPLRFGAVGAPRSPGRSVRARWRQPSVEVTNRVRRSSPPNTRFGGWTLGEKCVSRTRPLGANTYRIGPALLSSDPTVATTLPARRDTSRRYRNGGSSCAAPRPRRAARRSRVGTTGVPGRSPCRTRSKRRTGTSRPWRRRSRSRHRVTHHMMTPPSVGPRVDAIDRLVTEFQSVPVLVVGSVTHSRPMSSNARSFGAVRRSVVLLDDSHGVALRLVARFERRHPRTRIAARSGRTSAHSPPVVSTRTAAQLPVSASNRMMRSFELSVNSTSVPSQTDVRP